MIIDSDKYDVHRERLHGKCIICGQSINRDCLGFFKPNPDHLEGGHHGRYHITRGMDFNSYSSCVLIIPQNSPKTRKIPQDYDRDKDSLFMNISGVFVFYLGTV